MAVASAWRIAAASVVGSSHVARGEPCQDHHHVEETAGGALIALASDGAGSASHGGDGAVLLCSRVAESVRRHLTGLHLAAPCSRRTVFAVARGVGHGIRAARTEATARATAHGGSINDYHATLVGAVMVPGHGGLTFHIGDGAALAMRRDGSRWMLSAPTNGEFADTTYFFTDDRWPAHLRLSRIDADLDTLFVMTDGVTDLGLTRGAQGSQPFMGFFGPIGAFLAEQSRDRGEAALVETLAAPAICARTTDDKTLVWAQADAA